MAVFCSNVCYKDLHWLYCFGRLNYVLTGQEGRCRRNLQIALKKWEKLQQLTLNSESYEREDNYYDKTQKLFKAMSA